VNSFSALIVVCQVTNRHSDDRHPGSGVILF
jgi:hypothetical protein